MKINQESFLQPFAFIPHWYLNFVELVKFFGYQRSLTWVKYYLNRINRWT